MEIRQRASGVPRSLAILSASFHPPTVAHVALAESALEVCDEVLLVIPRVFPHKAYQGVGFEDRLKMVEAVAGRRERWSVGISEQGLFLDIARETRAVYDPHAELWFVCGRDAAERIVNWDYGRPGVAEEMLEQFGLLVAPRGGDYSAPASVRKRVQTLRVPEEISGISATEVREKILRREHWEDWVPPAIHDLVRRFYA